ncbi:MAG: xanthine dehydrogenase small subunit [Burkholderiales bacterium]|nr:xanthine dehydrogenase small subunit [Burkholderiales bacterium]
MTSGLPSSPASPAATGGARPIRFFHRGAVVEVAGLPPTTTVLAWLREHAHRTGTKEGCNEGDCGACTVLVGQLQPDDSLAWQPRNACIQFLPTLDGQALLTVEDLALPPGSEPALHPVQQAMVDCHGSQCGFCTPGFVMSLTACYEAHQDSGTRPTRQALADALSGNLCRCTGYRPILAAGERMFTLPERRIDAGPIVAALKALRADPPLEATGFAAPRSLDHLAALRLARPQARLLAGGTDIGLWVNKQLRRLDDLVYLGRVAELHTVREAEGQLQIGAAASLEAAWNALARHWPHTREMGLRFASPPIRLAGTMGGNLANGSPIGDAAPVLMALGASLVLRRGQAQRTLPLEDFYLGYMSNQLAEGEFLQAIQVPLPQPQHQLRAYKLSKRFDSDISALAAGLWLQLDAGVVRAARFAFGGMAATVQRARGAEAAVVGQTWTEATLQAAMAALEADFTPLTDLRASAAYRRRAARHLLQRLWLETRPEAPLAPEQLSVWSAR